MQVKTVLPARPGSYEYAFRKTGLARTLTDWRGPVWFEETRAVTPLPARHEQGVPETYPFGLWT